jgi:hypothetical protein
MGRTLQVVGSFLIISLHAVNFSAFSSFTVITALILIISLVAELFAVKLDL